MFRRPRILAVGVLLSIGVVVPAVAQDYYAARLRAGEAALDAGRPADAAEDLRIASFGFLEKPPMLCEALEHLALAQQSAGRGADVDATLARLVEAANASPACREARLEPARRTELETLVRKKLPAKSAELILAPPAAPSVAAPAATRVPPPTATPVPRPAATSTAAPAPPPTSPPAVATPVPPRAATPIPRPTAIPTTPPVATPAPNRSPTAPHPPPTANAPEPTRAPAVARPAESPSTVASEELDRQPQLKATTRPVYPASAQRAGIGGIVLLRVLVSDKGEPLQVEVARGVEADLDQAAVAAVRQWTFEPGQKGGASVAAWMTVAVPFDAQRR